MESPWKILGLPRNSNRDEIRKAYAIALKKIDQDENPAGFQRLNSAYRQALKFAESKDADVAPLAGVFPEGQSQSSSYSSFPVMDSPFQNIGQRSPTQTDVDVQTLHDLLQKEKSEDAVILLKQLLDSEYYRPIPAKQSLEDGILDLPFETFKNEKPFLAECIRQFYWRPNLTARTFREFQMNRILENYQWPEEFSPKKPVRSIDDYPFNQFLNTKAGMFSTAAFAIFVSFGVLTFFFMRNPANSIKSIKEIFLGKPALQITVKVDYAFPLLDAYRNLEPDSEKLLITSYQNIVNYFSTKSAEENRSIAAHGALTTFGGYLPIAKPQLTVAYLRAHIAFIKELFSINPILVNQIHYPILVGTAQAAEVAGVKSRENLITAMKDIISDHPRALTRVIFIKDGAKLADDYRQLFRRKNPGLAKYYEKITVTRSREEHRRLAKATIAYCEGLQSYSGYEIGEIMFRMFKDP